MRIGFIGLGRMGGPIAENLLKAGHSVTVWNRSPGPVQQLVGQGAVAAQTPQAAMQGDAVFSMLSNDAVMREVGLAGPLLENAKKDLIHINMATISAAFAQELQAAHAKAGLAYLSAPLLSTQIAPSFRGPGPCGDVPERPKRGLGRRRKSRAE
jgi:3-hydroxyisobutyrate dehydrogenase-like beta-hydroxyacid dehydrogenase